MAAELLHPILGTDKKNACFSVYSTPNEKDFHVYFGMALLERVNQGTDSFQYKSLLGRLYNAGIKRKTLVETFEHPLSTLRRWGDAMKSGDVNVILKAFSGQGAQRRLTPKIEGFIRLEFRRIYPTNRYSYSKEIISRVEKVFETSFSSECLRPIFNDEKKSLDEASDNADILSSDSQNKAKSCDSPDKAGSNSEKMRKYSLSNKNVGDEENCFFLHHIGIVIAMFMIDELQLNEKIVRQWICSVLLGAVNLEQSESLDFNALNFFIANAVISSARNQHSVLARVATEDNLVNLFKNNALLTDAENSEYFYYDPHSIHYSGMKDVLKGWCGSRGKICKVNYQDFFHTAAGDPVYFEIHDNYLDMRERFTASVDFFTRNILELPTAVFVIDRGIYGREKMLDIHNSGYGLVTWEKNYKGGAWEKRGKQFAFKIKRPKNNSRDIKTWKIRYFKDFSWDAIPGFHRIIVRISSPGKGANEAEVSILSNGRIRDETAVFAMLNRWLQENDFRYMVSQFGLNQITSYKAREYAQIEEVLEEKKVLSENYKMLQQAEASIKSDLKKALLKKHRKKQPEALIKSQIDLLTKQLESLSTQKKSVKKYVDKAEKMAKEGKHQLCSGKKSFLDAVKIIARNIFYKLIRVFRPIYDNFRNDHQLLRELIRAHGICEIHKSGYTFLLAPPRNFSPSLRKSVDAFLAEISNKINSVAHETPPIKIILRKSENLFL